MLAILQSFLTESGKKIIKKIIMGTLLEKRNISAKQNKAFSTTIVPPAGYKLGHIHIVDSTGAESEIDVPTAQEFSYLLTLPLPPQSIDVCLLANTVGNGLKFDGVNDYVQTPHSSVFNFGTGSFSASFWVSTSSIRTAVFYSKYVNPTIGGFSFILWNDRKIAISLSNSNGQYCVATTNSFLYNINTLYNFTFQRNGNIIEIYVNGVLVSNTNTFYGSILNVNQINVNTTIPSTIGVERPILYPFLGNIYDLKVFNKALSQAEVTLLYNSFGNNLTGLTSNLVANYDFEQKSGTILLDHSGNTLNGTLTNFANTSLGASNAWVDKFGNPILS